MPFEQDLLRTIHVLGAAIWTGMTFYQASVLMPAVKAEPDAGPRLMRRLLVQGKLMRWLLIAGWTTVIAGILLYGLGEFFRIDQASTRGILLNLGVVMGLIAVGIGTLVGYPAARKLKGLVGGDAPPPESEGARIGALQKRLGMATHVVLGLQVLTIIVMVASAPT